MSRWRERTPIEADALEVISWLLPTNRHAAHTAPFTREETARVLAFRHTRPAYPVHLVVIPKVHISSLTDFAPGDDLLLLVIREVAQQVLAEHGACRVVTNLGTYQEEVKTSTLARNIGGSAAYLVICGC